MKINLLNKIKLTDPRVMITILILIVSLALIVWQYSIRNIEVTDNAIIRCNWVDVVPEINGVIKNIKFEDNQFVTQGDVVVTIEDDLFDARYRKAKAAYETSKYTYKSFINDKDLIEIQSNGNIKKSNAILNESNSNKYSVQLEIKEIQERLNSKITILQFSKKELVRIENLFKNNLISERQYQKTKLDYDSSLIEKKVLTAKLESVRNKLKSEEFKIQVSEVSANIYSKTKINLINKADTDISSAKNNIELSMAELDLAKFYLDKTSLKVLRTGQITNRRLSEGDYVEIGQPIASIMSCNKQAWIEANFKETQIGRMKIGQDVHIEVDAYPGTSFEGKVVGISYGSGATFSVLPPENSVGNFTKIVQRFPIKIDINNNRGYAMRVGMSTIVTVILE